MAVSPLHINHFAQQTPLSHVERVELKEIIAAVLEHHHVQALALAQVDERPNFVQVHGRRHLDGHVMAMFQCLTRHQVVMKPVGGDIHQVDVGATAQVLIAILTIIDVCRGHGGFAQDVLAGLGTVTLVVTQRFHLNAGDMGPALHSIRAAHAQPHEGYPHDRNFLNCKSQRRPLTTRSLRHLGHDGPVLDGVRPVELRQCA